MSRIEELRSLAARDIEPCPPSRPLVYHLFILNEFISFKETYKRQL
jgi:hypothetical protein